MAGYVDLNSVRAGIVEDPKEYRYCGYAEAEAGNPKARAGIMSLFEPGKSWEEVSAEYRKYLYVKAGKADRSGKAVLSREQIKEVLDKDGRLEMWEVLRLRVRYFSDGLVLGSKEYVEGVFEEYRERLGVKREEGAKELKPKVFEGMAVMREQRRPALE
ncbi:MAG: transposase, partial [Verrucomicrobia bacterium]|nr:transposase [Verrucomicrobiota bacterium]